MEPIDQFIYILSGLKEIDYKRLRLDIDREIKTRFASEIIDKNPSQKSERLDELIGIFLDYYNVAISAEDEELSNIEKDISVILQEIIVEMDIIICTTSSSSGIKPDVTRNEPIYDELDSAVDDDYVYPPKRKVNRSPRHY